MRIAILLYDRFAALDAVGPYEVLSRLPGASVTFVGVETGPVRTEIGTLALCADAELSELTDPEIVLIPGGFGTRALLDHAEILDWIRAADETSTYTTSVCTGALLLGAAGLLSGRPATTHWLLLEELSRFGATPVSERVVRDGKLITAAGVSAGIDMALSLAAEIAGPKLAQAIQLGIEYDPAPPFPGGSLHSSPPEIVELVRANAAELA